MRRGKRGKRRKVPNRPPLKTHEAARHDAVDETATVAAIVKEFNPARSENTSGDDRSSLDRKMVRWTLVVALAPCASAAIGGIGIYATLQVGSTSDETQRAAQRPWIKYDGLEIIEPLTFGGGLLKTRRKWRQIRAAMPGHFASIAGLVTPR
jgi:hypothetical protein